MANFCNECCFWEKNILYKVGSNFGICHCVEVSMKLFTDTTHKLKESEEQVLYTDGYFGCVQHRKGPPLLFNFEEDIDPDTGEVKD